MTEGITGAHRGMNEKLKKRSVTEVVLPKTTTISCIYLHCYDVKIKVTPVIILTSPSLSLSSHFVATHRNRWGNV